MDEDVAESRRRREIEEDFLAANPNVWRVYVGAPIYKEAEKGDDHEQRQGHGARRATGPGAA